MMVGGSKTYREEVETHRAREREARMKNKSDEEAIIDAFRPAPAKGELPHMSFERMGEPDWLTKQRINMRVDGVTVEQESDRDECEASEKSGKVIVAWFVIAAFIAIATFGAWALYEGLERMMG